MSKFLDYIYFYDIEGNEQRAASVDDVQKSKEQLEGDIGALGIDIAGVRGDLTTLQTQVNHLEGLKLPGGGTKYSTDAIVSAYSYDINGDPTVTIEESSYSFGYGSGSISNGHYSVLLGKGDLLGEWSTCIGYENYISANAGYAFGYNCSVTGYTENFYQGSVAIGFECNADGGVSFAIGDNCNSQDRQMVLGYYSEEDAEPRIKISNGDYGINHDVIKIYRHSSYSQAVVVRDGVKIDKDIHVDGFDYSKINGVEISHSNIATDGSINCNTLTCNTIQVNSGEFDFSTRNITASGNITASDGTLDIKDIIASGNITASNGTLDIQNITASGNITASNGRLNIRDISVTGNITDTDGVYTQHLSTHSALFWGSGKRISIEDSTVTFIVSGNIRETYHDILKIDTENNIPETKFLHYSYYGETPYIDSSTYINNSTLKISQNNDYGVNKQAEMLITVYPSEATGYIQSSKGGIQLKSKGNGNEAYIRICGSGFEDETYRNNIIDIESTNMVRVSSGNLSCNNAWTVDSDLNKKKDIESLSDEYSILFDKLKPVRFKYKDNQHNRYHTGLIAQELEAAIEESGLTTQDVAAFVKTQTEEEETYGVRYEELVALCINEIQKLKAENEKIRQELKLITK